ncbi:MAG TPA: acyl carrier protein [Candidatus Eisenbergiella intestinipullorum]|nr:acyl carrier protein [Candidatus Eisenbergiella intestinipullorum]
MFEKLAELICNYVEVEPQEVHPDSRFVEDLGFSSFDFMSMLGEAEEEFGVEIDPQKASGILTVQEAADYLQELCEK